VLLTGALVVGGIVVVIVQPWKTTSPLAGIDPTAAASYFLDHYELASGEVVRLDQGGDTVSEGEGYAMLLSAAIGDQARFESAWDWSVAHLEQPNGLFAWHFAGGHVVDPSPAADADLDIAWALVIAARRFHDSAYLGDARRIGDAIVANESVVVKGLPTLVAGPWARQATPIVNPSYFAPLAMASLALLGNGGVWGSMAASSRLGMRELLASAKLPPDWATIDPPGMFHPASPPGQPATPALYGFNAVRVPIWLASSCDATDRALAAGMWPTLSRAVASGPNLVNLGLDGTPAEGASPDPVGLVGAAAAAQASGAQTEVRTLLERADHMNRANPTYYGSALVAMGEVLLSSGELRDCETPSETAFDQVNPGEPAVLSVSPTVNRIMK